MIAFCPFAPLWPFFAFLGSQSELFNIAENCGVDRTDVKPNAVPKLGGDLHTVWEDHSCLCGLCVLLPDSLCDLNEEPKPESVRIRKRGSTEFLYYQYLSEAESPSRNTLSSLTLNLINTHPREHVRHHCLPDSSLPETSLDTDTTYVDHWNASRGSHSGCDEACDTPRGPYSSNPNYKTCRRDKCNPTVVLLC